MKKYLLCIFALLQIISFSYTQNIEKLGEIETLTSYQRMNTIIPSDTYVDEINNYLYCRSDRGESQSIYNLNKISEEPKKKNYFAKTTTETFVILNNSEIHFSEMAFEIKRENEVIVNGPLSSGISFILKKGSGFIVYYIDTNGCPGAVDTSGRIYSSEEAMAYLKEYDPEKYEQSKKTSSELELYNDFIRNRVLIWGKTHYMKHNVMVQYDLQGNYYFMQDFGSLGSDIGCYFNDKCIFYKFTEGLNPYSEIIKNCKDGYYSSSWYVGFGGNIYYYIASKEYTEVFRIRRTWGDPDFYAMAINGYTEDDYGKYVDEVLPKLSKADLRLLRNTIFALYGVHFKSADLSKYFDKQVWYTDEGKTSADVTLPEHRQKLVEMIQKLEK
ncbi:YARHG domain-containing protein [Treponema bryantii]|uniref:YARHG domain-containing protein n=1 Tax=Treponema bryantii TaxID=163 RepID=UPI002B3057D9|nr:hypothetical protein TRBR_15430 [Treponema bryantii]